MRGTEHSFTLARIHGTYYIQDMANKTYKITNSNGMGGGVWARSYESRQAAADAIAHAMGWDDAVLSPSWSDDEDNTCWSVYATQGECDADLVGALAPCITRVYS